MPNPRDQRLQQLVALAQLYDSMNRGQQRTQENQQQNEIARMGLTQQGENQKAMLAQQQAALTQQGQWHQDELAQKAMALGQQQQNETNRLGAENAWHQQKATADTAQNDRMMQQQMLQGYTALPGATPEGFAQMGSSLNVPGMDQYLNQGQEVMAQGQAAALQQMLGPIYGQFKKSPQEAQRALDMAWQDPRMGSQRVQDRLAPWLRQQNEGLAISNNPAQITDPAQITAQRQGEMQGGLFGRGGMFDMRDQTPPEVIAQRNQYQQDNPYITNLPGPFSAIFGASEEQRANKQRLDAQVAKELLEQRKARKK